MTVVSIEHLTKQYSNHRGVRDLSFSMEKGEVLGLLGANGSGKTTTMKVIVGLLQSNKGSVTLFGNNIEESSVETMEHVGCMIEAPGVYLYLTGKQNLQMVARMYTEIKAERIEELLELVELESYKHEKVKKYSMGMKQRLAFAMALMANPKLLILDEPTNGMDIEGTTFVRKILQSEAKAGCTILLSSHLAHEIEQLCTRVAVMEDGVLIDTAFVPEMIKVHGSIENYYMSVVGKRKVRSH